MYMYLIECVKKTSLQSDLLPYNHSFFVSFSLPIQDTTLFLQLQGVNLIKLIENVFLCFSFIFMIKLKIRGL